MTAGGNAAGGGAAGGGGADRTYPFRFAAAYRLPALLFGVTPRTAMVRVAEEELSVRFGPWKLRTPRANLVGAELSHGFGYLKTAGPAHLSLVDRGITFATNGELGLCLRFAEPVTVLDPTGHLRHPGATLTVGDPAGLAADLGLQV
jgi:hypothetical protein